MIAETNYTVPLELMQETTHNIPNFDSRLDLNERTGNFFYDKWVILPEFKNTVWEDILSVLPLNVGQARLMKLEPGRAYYSHADIDDRYHLNISGSKSYLVDLDHDTMYPTILDGKWYSMDAGVRHSAVNFGNDVRVQLVVRNLLQHGSIANPINVEIGLLKSFHNFRYIFDDVFSKYLNQMNKQYSIDNFKIVNEYRVSFTIESSNLEDLKNLCPAEFEIKHEC